MRSVKISTRHLPSCDNLPWESEEERIRRKFPEKEKKWLQPYIANSSKDHVSDQDVRCSYEAKEGYENVNRKSVFSRIGRNKHMQGHAQTFVRATLRDEKESTPTIFGQSSKCYVANLHERNPQTKSARRQTVCEKTSSDVQKFEQMCETGKKPRACKHRIKEEERRSEGLFQQERISKFEDQRSEKKLNREVSREANDFRSGSRIYGGLGRQINWTWGEETCNATDEQFPDTDETVLPEPQNSLSTYETNVMANYVKKETELTKSNTETEGVQKSPPNFQEENLLTDILTFSDGVSDDSDGSNSCQDSRNHYSHASYNLQSADLERTDDLEHQLFMDCANSEDDPKHLELMDNIPENELHKIGDVGVEGAVNSKLGLPKVEDLEEGEVVGDFDIKGVQITREVNEGERDRTLHIKSKDSKSHIKNARDHFEPDSWKSSKHRTDLHQGCSLRGSYCDNSRYKEVYGSEKCQALMSLKRTRKRDLPATENTWYDRNARSSIRLTRSLQCGSRHMYSARTYLESDFAMPQVSDPETILRSNKPILSDNASRTSIRTLSVESKKLEHNEYLQCHVKPISPYRGKENVEKDDCGCIIDVQKSKLNSSNQQSKSFATEFKEKCSIKPSTKRELMLGADESMQAKPDKFFIDDKTKSIYDGETEGFKCKVTENIRKVTGEWSRDSRSLSLVGVHAERLPENERMTRNKEKSASPVQSWNRATKVAKLADGYPEHKSLRESADSTKDSCNAIMPRKFCVEDFSHKFRVKQQPCIPKRPKEEDSHRVNQRLRQINFGKNTLGYERYIDLVPRHKRLKSDPRTPDIHQVCSKRSWDGQVSKWRRSLHFYDPPVEEDEEFPEEIGIISMIGIDIRDKEGQVSASLPVEEQVVKDSDLSIYGDWMDFGPADEQLFKEDGMDTMN